MMYYWRRYIIGGRSGGRETAWFIFLLWLAGVIYIARAEAVDREVALFAEMIKLMALPVIGLLAYANGLKWMGDEGAPLIRRKPKKDDPTTPPRDWNEGS